MIANAGLGDENHIVSWVDSLQQRQDRGSQQTLGPIALYRAAHRLARGYRHSQLSEVIGEDDKHNKRVGIGLSQAPHPFEISRPAKAKTTLHLAAIGS